MRIIQTLLSEDELTTAQLRQRMPDAQIVVLDEVPATGHYPQVENPEAVLAALLPFLTANDE